MSFLIDSCPTIRCHLRCEFLHDLQEDPDQLKNLAGTPGHDETLNKMRRRCDELVNRYGGPLPPLSERGARQPRRK